MPTAANSPPAIVDLLQTTVKYFVDHQLTSVGRQRPLVSAALRHPPSVTCQPGIPPGAVPSGEKILTWHRKGGSAQRPTFQPYQHTNILVTRGCDKDTVRPFLPRDTPHNACKVRHSGRCCKWSGIGEHWLLGFRPVFWVIAVEEAHRPDSDQADKHP